MSWWEIIVERARKHDDVEETHLDEQPLPCVPPTFSCFRAVSTKITGWQAAITQYAFLFYGRERRAPTQTQAKQEIRSRRSLLGNAIYRRRLQNMSYARKTAPLLSCRQTCYQTEQWTSIYVVDWNVRSNLYSNARHQLQYCAARYEGSVFKYCAICFKTGAFKKTDK